MEMEVLKKKISTFRGEGGRVKITDDQLLMEILFAWEQWKGPLQDFYRAIGVSANGMASIIGRAKKLRREGHFPVSEFKEIKIEPSGGLAPLCNAPLTGSAVELCLETGRVIRFAQLDVLLEFLKKAA